MPHDYFISYYYGSPQYFDQWKKHYQRQIKCYILTKMQIKLSSKEIAPPLVLLNL
jgi:hypothetical protein